jgi:DNA-binding transcriptional ArsR family regulator
VAANEQMGIDRLSTLLTAVSSPQRLRILAALANRPVHVSELAREVGMSRPLLYMHLAKLEEAGFVAGRLELSSDGKALKIFEVVPFSMIVDVETIVGAARLAQAAPTTDAHL